MTLLLNNKFFVIFFAPFILGALTILGFSPFNFTFVNFLSFPILLFLIYTVKKKTKTGYRKKKSNRYFFYLGCAFGFGFFLIGNYWISISLTHDEMFIGLIPFALILIPLFLSFFFGLTCLIVGFFAEKKISFILIFSLVFSIFEFLRGNLLTGFPWNLISYTWSWSTEVVQILSVIGTYSLSLISITIFCIPFLLLEKHKIKKNIIIFSIFLTIFVGNYFYGFNKINMSSYKYDENIIIKIISPNFSLKDYTKKSETEQLKKLIKISDPEQDKKTLFIWPEGIFYESYLQDLLVHKDLFLNNFNENHVIIFGINNFVNADNPKDKKYYNSLVAVNHKLEILSVYNKINLVPFGEFLPFEKIFSILGLKKITFGYNSFTAGDIREVIDLGSKFNNKILIPLICYEIIYSGKIKLRNQLPDLVVNISEDAWFGESIGPYQHYTKAIYRAVEEGVFIARSANRGISSIIDPNGRSIKILERSESGNIEHRMPKFSGSTLYSLYGNKIFFLIIFLYIFLILIFKKIET